MASRRKPSTYLSLTRLIGSIRQRAAGIPVGDLPFSNTRWTAFDAAATQWMTEWNERNLAESVKQLATDLAQPAGDELRMYCSHFIQGLNNAIARGEIPASVRPMYNLPGDGAALPDMGSGPKLRSVAEAIVSGEAARVGAGGTAMADATAAKVAAKLAIYSPLEQDQAQKFEAASKEEKDLFNLFSDVVMKTMRLFDQLEFDNDTMTAAELRNLCRGWGMTYVFDDGEAFTLELTVEPGSNYVVNDRELGEFTSIEATLKTPGGGITMCRNVALGCETGGIALIYDEKVTATTPDLVGIDAYLVFTNLTATPSVVKLKMVG